MQIFDNYSTQHLIKVKGQTLVIAPLCRQALLQRRSGTWRAPSSVAHTCLCIFPAVAGTHLPTPKGWRVNPGPGGKEQLAHGCYATACGQRNWNPDLAIVSPAR